MRKLVATFLSFALLGFGQQPAPPPPPAPPAAQTAAAQTAAAQTATDGAARFTSSTQLVVETVVVKDKSGKTVPNLTASRTSSSPKTARPRQSLSSSISSLRKPPSRRWWPIPKPLLPGRSSAHPDRHRRGRATSTIETSVCWPSTSTPAPCPSQTSCAPSRRLRSSSARR